MDYMEQALSLAGLALGQVSPNPAVGAVIVKDEEVVGQGYTQPPGSAHAEVVALEQAGSAAQNSVMYVTLEPCCHFGRTPPCTGAIVTAGVAEVHMAMLDPDPRVSGKGEEELRRQGIGTFVGEHEEDAREVNETYIKYVTTGIPFVTAKFAMSLDGKIATRSGDSRWISNQESRRYVHSLRHITDAVMVGVNTVLTDDPQLTCRCGERGGVMRKQPLRIIVDANGRTPVNAQVFGEPGRALLALGEGVKLEIVEGYQSMNADVVELPSSEGLVDLEQLLKVLGQREITSILVEGGGTLLGYMFDHGLVDKVVAFVAPVIIGGSEAETAVGGRGVDKIADSIHLERVTAMECNGDVMVSGYIGG
ncbi:MAG: bifunctional diaminohydroxyphosphoribosylaminopyrimidine deaminase/5-amino-6-(5-phosphoribosylamino)uracil reductase RibD [Dehalococcoidales bacterium]|nr:MAG: bifunctional diaminohydroxyphosphoribosylaminopyrimidine deaminase/5-amino-6-(5-phosphoribosylamino)uracil reductase RibD [Dehalococcoidales bacterium]